MIRFEPTPAVPNTPLQHPQHVLNPNNPKRGKGTGHRLDKKELYNLMMYNDYFNNPEHSEDQLFDEIVQLDFCRNQRHRCRNLCGERSASEGGPTSDVDRTGVKFSKVSLNSVAIWLVKN